MSILRYILRFFENQVPEVPHAQRNEVAPIKNKRRNHGGTV